MSQYVWAQGRNYSSSNSGSSKNLLIFESIKDNQKERGPCSFSRSLQKLAVLFKINSFPRLGLGLVV